MVLKKNEEDQGQVKDLKRKANVIMRQVWEIRERWFKEDFKRMWLFSHLMLRVLMYGGEIWRWKEREELEKVQKKYIK